MLNVVNIKDVKLKAGELTKTLRKRENLSQEQLAEKLGLSRYTITNLESGQNATLDTLFKILQYFDMLEAFNGFIDNEINNRSQESLY
jgi:transcriptional regulator with XRE-family HTH domain